MKRHDDGEYRPRQPHTLADLPLFAEPVVSSAPKRVRDTDPATSHAAAEQAEPGAARDRESILVFLASRGHQGATADEIERAHHWDGPKATRRLSELFRDGLVVRDPRLTRLTSRGRAAMVYVLAPKSLDASE